MIFISYKSMIWTKEYKNAYDREYRQLNKSRLKVYGKNYLEAKKEELYKVYFLFDKRNHNDIKYIGFCNNIDMRIKNHSRMRSKLNHLPVKQWFKEVGKDNIGYEIVFEDTSKKIVEYVEANLIYHYSLTYELLNRTFIANNKKKL